MKTIGLVDFSHALRVNYHVRPGDGSPTQAGEQTLAQLSDWRRGLDHLIVCLDSPPYERSKVYAEYKAGRPRDEGYTHLVRWTKERLVADGYSIAAHPGAEADDVIATLARKLDGDIRIFGADKDCLQCIEVSDICTVRQFAPGTGGFEIRDFAWVHKRYGVSPVQIPLLLAIMGDKGDNIPGIAGIGEKGAAKLITTYGTLSKMRIAAIEAFEASKQEGAKPLSSFWQKFLDGSPKLADWLALTTLRTDLPLDVDALLKKQPIKPLVPDMVSAENIDHGDAWEPSSEELQEERAMLDPEVVISGPKELPARSSTASAVSAGPAPVNSAARESSTVSGEAKTEHTKAAAGRAESTPPATAPMTPASNGTAPRAKQQLISDESVSIVVDRPAPPSWALALQPNSVREASILSTRLWNSRHYMQLEHEPGVLSIILKGRELGLGAMAALEMFFLVKGRPYPSAKGKHFLALRDPNCVWFTVTSADENHATVKTKHREAGLLEYTYTIERAQRAGYLNGSNKHNWQIMPQEMLEARAKSKGADRWYPGSTFGMPTVEEIQDGEESDDE